MPAYELYDELSGTFLSRPAVTLQLEHSLLSISKWESKWKIPFLTKEEKTPEQFVDYVRCMTINQKVDPLLYSRLTRDDFLAIQQYIDDPMTATTFQSYKKEKPSREVVTSELIYYWMNAAQIPMDAEKWHLNRLMTLIRIHSVKQDKSKMPKSDIYKQNKALNAARRAKHGSRG